ncbi:MAG: hypothetical protein J6L82_02590 [Alphaproteobacteria bacterium]|nr:hypothetical protein [Alphaproteobacteria bacterium]
MAKVKKALTAIGKAGLKTVADLDPVSSFFKNVYEEYTSFSAKERAEKVAKTFEDRLEKLEKEIGKQKIVETPNLASLFANAQNGALTDIEEDKIGLYANAFINAIKNEKMEDTKKHIFLNMLREFSLAHLKILHLFYDNPSTERFMTIHVISNHIKIYEENNEDLIHSLVSDIIKKGLLIEHPCGFVDGISYSINKPSSSNLGQEFLSFISEQEEING